MSDKQIVERNGVSMDRHRVSSKLDEVPPFSYENVKITSSVNVPASEVEAAKIAVMAAYEGREVECRHIAESWCIYLRIGKSSIGELIGYSVISEDAAWLDAASKLPAPLTEDAPKYAPVGEREGKFENSAFEEWVSTTVGFTGDDVLFAHSGWNARAALASKPSPEADDEAYANCGCGVLSHYNAGCACGKCRKYQIAKPSPEGIPDQFDGLRKLAEHCEKHNRFVQVSGSEMIRILALLSDKDAESARLTDELKIETELSDKRAGLWLKEYERAEAAESELYALKLSSARVRDEGKAEGMRDAAKVAAAHADSRRNPILKLSPQAMSVSALVHQCELIESDILSLIPTSPESKEGEQ